MSVPIPLCFFAEEDEELRSSHILASLSPRPDSIPLGMPPREEKKVKALLEEIRPVRLLPPLFLPSPLVDLSADPLLFFLPPPPPIFPNLPFSFLAHSDSPSSKTSFPSDIPSSKLPHPSRGEPSSSASGRLLRRGRRRRRRKGRGRRPGRGRGRRGRRSEGRCRVEVSFCLVLFSRFDCSLFLCFSATSVYPVNVYTLPSVLLTLVSLSLVSFSPATTFHDFPFGFHPFSILILQTRFPLRLSLIYDAACSK